MTESRPDNAIGDRPPLDERAEYVPRARVERFIVRGLAECIPAAIEHWGTSGIGGKGNALDVGCGRQPFRRLLEKRGFTYTGLDTQQNADGTTAFVAAIDGVLPDELLAQGPFEFILCTEVLEHVADWPAAWGNMTRLLCPGGRMLITCPHLYPLHEEPYDFWRPTPHAMRFFAARHGLRVVRSFEVGNGWDVVGTVAMAVSPRPTRGFLNPVSRLFSHPLALIARAGRKLVFRAASSASMRRLMDVQTKLYLSNIIILEKPM